MASAENESDIDLIWSRVIDETAQSYLMRFPLISSSEEYRNIGQALVTKYPLLKRLGLNQEWVS